MKSSSFGLPGFCSHACLLNWPITVADGSLSLSKKRGRGRAQPHAVHAHPENESVRKYLSSRFAIRTVSHGPDRLGIRALPLCFCRSDLDAIRPHGTKG